MTVFNQVWSTSFSAGIIASTATGFFGNELETQEKRQRHGSANGLIINSLAGEVLRIDLDGNSDRTIGLLQPNGHFIISPEDGIFFDFITLTNVSGTDTVADEIQVKIYQARQVG